MLTRGVNDIKIAQYGCDFFLSYLVQTLILSVDAILTGHTINNLTYLPVPLSSPHSPH